MALSKHIFESKKRGSWLR